MLTFDWWKQGHKIGLKTVSRTWLSYCVSFLFNKVSSAGYLFVSFTHDSRQPKWQWFTAKVPFWRATNGNI